MMKKITSDSNKLKEADLLEDTDSRNKTTRRKKKSKKAPKPNEKVEKELDAKEEALDK